MGLESIVNVQISRETASVSQAGFGTGLILGPNKVASGVGTYTSLEEVLAEPGLTSSTGEYIAASKYFGQTPKPKTLKIGKRLTNVAQIETVTPVAVNDAVYTVTINGVDFVFTADPDALASEIVTGLIALINAGSEPVTASGTSTLILTADVAGIPFTLALGSNLSVVHTAANVGVAESLASLSVSDDDWYALIMVSKTVGDILQAAAYIEGAGKLYAVSKGDVAILDGDDSTDIFSLLMAASYFRTITFYSADFANYPEAGMLGRFLPYTPGSEQWSFKTIAGAVVDTLSPTQITALKAKTVNFYTRIAGNNVSQEGKVAGGEWIDVIRLIDLIKARMQEEIFGQLLRSPKIPFTNGGITSIESRVSSVLKANQNTGGIAPDDVDANGDLVPGFTTNFPKLSEVPANDRAARTLIVADAFSAKLAGAIVAVEINGTVSV